MKLPALLLAILAPALSAAPLTSGNLVIVRIGDGNSPTSTTATSPGFIDEYTTGGALVQSIALPTTGVGQCTVSGATAASSMRLTPDGSRAYFTGYRAAVGTTNIPNSAVNRVLGFVGPSGVVDTTAASTDGNIGAHQGIASVGGTGNIYFSTGIGGVRVMNGQGNASTTTQIEAINCRQIQVSNGVLYSSNSVSSPNTSGIRTYGNSLPTAATTGTQIISQASATGFIVLDVSASQAGDDTIYLISSPSITTQNTLTKYCLVSGTWTAFGTVNLPANGGQWNVAGKVTGNTTTLYLMLNGFGGAVSSLYTYTDSTGYMGTISSTSFTSLVTSGTNTDFRGIALAPIAVDTTPPTVTSIVRRTPSTQTTTSTTATFRVTFSEAINAPATSNFTVTAVNSSSIVGTVNSVTAVNTSTYDVAVTVTSGTGEFRLRVVE